MGRIVVTEFVSLDGVMEDPGGSEHSKHGAWTFKFNRGDEGNKFKMDETNNAEAQLLGRVTYEGFAAAWPQRSGDPFSEKFNSMPKYVISQTLKKANWNNSTILKGNVVEQVRCTLAAFPQYRGEELDESSPTIPIGGECRSWMNELLYGLIKELGLINEREVFGSWQYHQLRCPY